MACSIVRLGLLSYVKHNTFSIKCYSKCVFISYMPSKGLKEMRAYNVHLLRSISTCNKPRYLSNYFDVKSITFNRPSVVKNHKAPLRFARTSASYTCIRSSPVDYLFERGLGLDLSEPQSDFSNEISDAEVSRNTNYLSVPNLGNKDDVHSDSLTLSSRNTGKKMDEESSNFFTLFGPSLKPISPSVDDIQKCGNEIFNEKHLCKHSMKKDEVGRHSVLYCSSPGSITPSPKKEPKDLGKPSEEQLMKVLNTLSEEIPDMFTQKMSFDMYSLDVIFENRFKGTRTVGIQSYMRQATLFCALAHIRFSFVKMKVLKITMHPEDSTVRVRWRAIGITALKGLPLLFRLKTYSRETLEEKMDDWCNGFSTFYVNEKGLVYKHIADRLMPDEERQHKKSFGSRIASMLGLNPKVPAPSSTAVTSSLSDVPREKADVPRKTKSVSPMIFNGYSENVI